MLALFMNKVGALLVHLYLRRETSSDGWLRRAFCCVGAEIFFFLAEIVLTRGDVVCMLPGRRGGARGYCDDVGMVVCMGALI